jgi:hypothetical protein
MRTTFPPGRGQGSILPGMFAKAQKYRSLRLF